MKTLLQDEAFKSAILKNVAYNYKITPESPWEPIRCVVNRLSAELGPTEVVSFAAWCQTCKSEDWGKYKRQSVSCSSIIRAFSIYGSMTQSGPSPAAPGFYSNAFKIQTFLPIYCSEIKFPTKVLIAVFATTPRIWPPLEAEKEISRIHWCTSFIRGDRCWS